MILNFVLFLLLLGVLLFVYKIGAYYIGKNYTPSVTYLWPRARTFRPNLSKPDVAIKYVQENQYAVRPLINKQAFPVFKAAERFFKDLNQGHRVIPELSMGAALSCASSEGFASINSKRIDIGVIDWTGNLILAIEYNGTGHYQGNAMGRDAVKRLALNKARVPLVEIIPDDDDARIIEKIKAACGIK